MLITYTLKNGLRVALQPIRDSHMAIVNVMYLVGSRNENSEKTGLAHLLEHIAFGGSVHVDNYDKALQKVGGKNNAYTSNDITNYWSQVPSNQLETALYLEADRLLGLAYKNEVIEVQRNVVIEEFKQSYHNKPYGDTWHMLCEQAYKNHPYAWPTIGKIIAHIEKITQQDIIRFGEQFYVPSNAILVIVGGINVPKVQQMVKKWFETIPYKQAPSHQRLPQETVFEASHLHTVRDVPQNALYKTFHIPGRQDYSGIKALVNYFDEGGKASLFYKVLVEKQQLVTEIEVYPTETMDPGLLIIEAKLQEGVQFDTVDKALQALLQQTIEKGLDHKALQKVKHQEEAAHAFNQVSAIHRAEEIAYAIMMGDALFFEKEIRKVKQLTSEEVQKVAKNIFADSNSHTLYYEAKKHQQAAR